MHNQPLLNTNKFENLQPTQSNDNLRHTSLNFYRFFLFILTSYDCNPITFTVNHVGGLVFCWLKNLNFVELYPLKLLYSIEQTTNGYLIRTSKWFIFLTGRLIKDTDTIQR